MKFLGAIIWHRCDANKRKVFRIGTVRYNWPMSAHASQAFSIAHCTDSEDLPNKKLFPEVNQQFERTWLPEGRPDQCTIASLCPSSGSIVVLTISLSLSERLNLRLGPSPNPWPPMTSSVSMETRSGSAIRVGLVYSADRRRIWYTFPDTRLVSGTAKYNNVNNNNRDILLSTIDRHNSTR